MFMQKLKTAILRKLARWLHGWATRIAQAAEIGPVSKGPEEGDFRAQWIRQYKAGGPPEDWLRLVAQGTGKPVGTSLRKHQVSTGSQPIVAKAFVSGNQEFGERTHFRAGDPPQDLLPSATADSHEPLQQEPVKPTFPLGPTKSAGVQPLDRSSLASLEMEPPSQLRSQSTRQDIDAAYSMPYREQSLSPIEAEQEKDVQPISQPASSKQQRQHSIASQDNHSVTQPGPTELHGSSFLQPDTSACDVSSSSKRTEESNLPPAPQPTKRKQTRIFETISKIIRKVRRRPMERPMASPMEKSAFKSASQDQIDPARREEKDINGGFVSGTASQPELAGLQPLRHPGINNATGPEVQHQTDFVVCESTNDQNQFMPRNHFRVDSPESTGFHAMLKDTDSGSFVSHKTVSQPPPAVLKESEGRTAVSFQKELTGFQPLRDSAISVEQWPRLHQKMVEPYPSPDSSDTAFLWPELPPISEEDPDHPGKLLQNYDRQARIAREQQGVW